MNTTSYISLIADKIADIKATIATTKTSDEISKNTRGTKLYKLGRDERVLNLINSLFTQLGDKVKLSDADMDTFVLITTLESERAERTSIAVTEGDSILDLMQKYANKKDLQSKLTKAAEKAGLVLNYKTGKIEKAGQKPEAVLVKKN